MVVINNLRVANPNPTHTSSPGIYGDITNMFDIINMNIPSLIYDIKIEILDIFGFSVTGTSPYITMSNKPNTITINPNTYNGGNISNFCFATLNLNSKYLMPGDKFFIQVSLMSRYDSCSANTTFSIGSTRPLKSNHFEI